MNTVDIITKKRDGHVLSREEIEYMVRGYTNGEIPDYQMSAFLMAIYFKLLNKQETVDLTQIMKDSGDVVDLSGINGIKVDKHSTGGVGDKTTLIVAPIVAAARVPVAKMSGRGLGFTGGTVDKLESIPGFNIAMDESEFIKQVNDKNIAVIGQTGHIAPADKKIYALRDVTGTVENLSLITSSIMSKKLSSGSDAIVLDVKCGKGAFMHTQDKAEELASLMVDIGNASGKNTIAIISDMNQPLGYAIGNRLEVIEAIDVLKDQGPDDITRLSLYLAGAMIYLGGNAKSIDEGIIIATDILESGAALKKFREFIQCQGGNPDITKDYDIIPPSRYQLSIESDEDGYITELDAMKFGIASQHTGAGREKKEDSIDYSAGILLNKKVGDEVKKGEIIYTLFGSCEDTLKNVSIELSDAVCIDKMQPKVRDIIYKVIG